MESQNVMEDKGYKFMKRSVLIGQLDCLVLYHF